MDNGTQGSTSPCLGGNERRRILKSRINEHQGRGRGLGGYMSPYFRVEGTTPTHARKNLTDRHCSPLGTVDGTLKQPLTAGISGVTPIPKCMPKLGRPVMSGVCGIQSDIVMMQQQQQQNQQHVLIRPKLEPGCAVGIASHSQVCTSLSAIADNYMQDETSESSVENGTEGVSSSAGSEDGDVSGGSTSAISISSRSSTGGQCSVDNSTDASNPDVEDHVSQLRDVIAMNEEKENELIEELTVAPIAKEAADTEISRLTEQLKSKDDDLLKFSAELCKLKVELQGSPNPTCGLEVISEALYTMKFVLHYDNDLKSVVDSVTCVVTRRSVNLPNITTFIQSNLQKLKGRPFKLVWSDDSDTLTSIRNESDLSIAIQNMTDTKIIKVLMPEVSVASNSATQRDDFSLLRIKLEIRRPEMKCVRKTIFLKESVVENISTIREAITSHVGHIINGRAYRIECIDKTGSDMTVDSTQELEIGIRDMGQEKKFTIEIRPHTSNSPASEHTAQSPNPEMNLTTKSTNSTTSATGKRYRKNKVRRAVRSPRKQPAEPRISECKVNSNVSDTLTKELKQPITYKCDRCKQDCGNLIKLKEHLRLHNHPIDYCTYCSFPYTYASTMTKHLLFHVKKR